MSRSRPIIGVTAHRTPAGKPFRLEPALAIPVAYLDAVTRAGGLAVALPPDPVDPPEAAARISHLDGLVLTGGPDVSPSRYGQDPDPHTYGVSDLQDGFETEVLAAARSASTPVLAICRGLQVVNVAFGGTLHQHISDDPALGPHGVPAGGGGAENRYVTEPGSRLAAVVGAEMTGRCHHHQAVDRVGEGLVVSARTADGVVEGLEPAAASGVGGWWMVAVQWHPEETAAEDGANQALFAGLVEAAR